MYGRVMHPKITEGIANSVDPDLGLHCLPRPIVRKLRIITVFGQTALGKQCRPRWVYSVCHSFCIFWKHCCMVEPFCSYLKMITTIFWGCLNFLDFYNMRKFPKYSDTPKICCNLDKIWTMWLSICTMWLCDGMANSVDPDQTAYRSSLIWVCTVSPDISVRKLRIITVFGVLWFTNAQVRQRWFKEIFLRIQVAVSFLKGGKHKFLLRVLSL